MSLVPLILLCLAILPIAAFFLQYVCFVCDSEQPSLRRAMAYVLATSACAYAVMDLSAYLLAIGMLDAGTSVPAYSRWFVLAPALKWQVLGQVPLIRYLPIAFGFTAGGVLQVFMLRVTFRVGALIFLLQWVVNLILLALLSWGVGILQRSLGINLFEAAEQKLDVGQFHARATPMLEGIYESFSKLRKDFFDPYLDPFKSELEPFTSHLPEPVQEFLNEGGWLLILALILVFTVLWLRITWRRMRDTLKQKKKTKKALHRALRENLNEVGPGVTEDGPKCVTVKGLPGRLRLIVLAPAGADVDDLDEAAAHEILEWLRPGLGEIGGYDYPKVRIWSHQYSGMGFPNTFFEHVPIPKSKTNRSHWVLLAGSVVVHKQRLHVGLAIYAEERNNLKTIKVGKDGWMDVLGIQGPAPRARKREEDYAPLR